MHQEAKCYNALNILYKCNYAKLQKFWENFGSWQKAWGVEGINSSLDAEEEGRKLEDGGISLILKGDDDFPLLLKEIPFCPFGIYVLGALKLPDLSIAVVGTRRATPKGKEAAKAFASKLGTAGFAVVSGLAMGIDEAAHQGALDGGGKTIAVLGTSLDNIYPKQNQGLAKRILEKGGAIISEFSWGCDYHPQNFLIRNRIISGLTRATLVIEAPEKSGALATARFALEQNREIFVVPGSIGAQNYKGSHGLIKAGAALVDGPEDILDFFDVKIEGKILELKETNEDENKILSVLMENGGELTSDKILEFADIDVGILNKNLAKLTIRGIIKEINGKYSLN